MVQPDKLGLDFMTVCQLDVFTAYPSVEGYPRVRMSILWVVCLAL